MLLPCMCLITAVMNTELFSKLLPKLNRKSTIQNDITETYFTAVLFLLSAQCFYSETKEYFAHGYHNVRPNEQPISDFCPAGLANC